MVYIILPVYNEEKNIMNVINDIRKALNKQKFHIVCVNDGSTDGTYKVLNTLKGKDLTVTGYRVNMNVGAVFSTGIEVVLRLANDDDVCVIMESDGTSSISLLSELIKGVEQGNDIAIASRHISGGGYWNFPFERLLFSQAANMMLRIIFPIKNVSDYTIFYRAYKISILREAARNFGMFGLIQSKGFTANAELLVKISLFAKNIYEFPFIYDYGKKQGKSKIGVVRTINEYLTTIGYLKGCIGKINKLQIKKIIK